MQRPKQSPGWKCNDTSALARQIEKGLNRQHMTQRDLCFASGIPEARLSRILNGGKVRITEQDINQIAIGLKWTKQKRDELRYIVWPELRYVDEALVEGENITALNCRLAEAGLPPIGFQE